MTPHLPAFTLEDEHLYLDSGNFSPLGFYLGTHQSNVFLHEMTWRKSEIEQNLSTHEISIIVLTRGNPLSTQYLGASSPVHIKGLLGSSQRSPEQRVPSDHGKGPRICPKQPQCFFRLLILLGPGLTVGGVLGEGLCLLLYLGPGHATMKMEGPRYCN